MLVTILCAVMMMAGLFIMLYAGVALIQDKRFLPLRPKRCRRRYSRGTSAFPARTRWGSS